MLQQSKSADPFLPRSGVKNLGWHDLAMKDHSSMVNMLPWWNGRHDSFKNYCLRASRFKSERKYHKSFSSKLLLDRKETEICGRLTLKLHKRA